MKTHKLSQSGNALFIILITIAIFAALSYTVGNMMRGGNAEKINETKLNMYAGEILDYARLMRAAVQDMRINTDCEASDISFENSIETGYEHTPDVDVECKIFDALGGGLKHMNPSPEWLVSRNSLDTSGPGYGTTFYSGHIDIDTIGTSCANAGSRSCRDIIMLIPYLKGEICDEINKNFGIEGMASKNINNFNYAESLKFVGSFSSTTNTTIGEGSPHVKGKMSGCFREWNHPSNTFYQVLYVR